MSSPINLLVLANPTAHFLRLLEELPPETNVVVGNQMEMLHKRAATAEVLVNCMQPLALYRELFMMCPNLKWTHSLSAGVENSLFPELIASAVPLTNARGAFSRSLAEFVICGALFFDKKIAAMRRQQTEHRWVNMDVDELHGKTMGIVSYGSIGAQCAALAKAFGMKVLAMRRRPELSANDPCVDRVYGQDGLKEMMAASDFVVACSPITPKTRGLIGAAELAVMKPSAVIMNIGRGTVIVEPALVEALREQRIRGAVLDVFDTEPLPVGHPLWTLDNVLLSPHSADHTPGWTDHSMRIFVRNFLHYAAGEPLENLVNKKEGY
ncbi:MAG: D-2-hydroxyacid dehydrogenase [Acidobacteria bacterium]|nr:D-2-hydroxyacid dehydrogenase [Acidobacteriota bacterium]